MDEPNLPHQLIYHLSKNGNSNHKELCDQRNRAHRISNRKNLIYIETGKLAAFSGHSFICATSGILTNYFSFYEQTACTAFLWLKKGGNCSGSADGHGSMQSCGSMYFRSTYSLIFLINIICNKLQWSQSQWYYANDTQKFTHCARGCVSIYCQLWKIYGFIHASVQAFEFICFVFLFFFYSIYLERNECQKDVSHCRSYLASDVCHRQVISTKTHYGNCLFFIS